MSRVRYFRYKRIFQMSANILGMRRYFKMCAYMLIGSKYFDMRRYFEMCAYILIGSEYFVCRSILGKRQYFNDFAVSSA